MENERAVAPRVGHQMARVLCAHLVGGPADGTQQPIALVDPKALKPWIEPRLVRYEDRVWAMPVQIVVEIGELDHVYEHRGVDGEQLELPVRFVHWGVSKR